MIDMPSDDNVLLVEVFHQVGDDPFICGVSGHATVGDLAELEAECRAESEEIFDKGDGRYLFDATWLPGQYGEYGRCELPPSWELSLKAFKGSEE